MIRGTLEEFSLSEIIRLISQARKTGELMVTGDSGSGRVMFRDGSICGAQSSSSHEPLGRKLVRFGVLSESQLWNALGRQDRSSLKIGETLVAAGLATQRDIDSALLEQVEDSIADVLWLEPSEFVWKAEAPPGGTVIISAEVVIDTVARRLDEIAMIRTNIPSDDATVSLAPIPPHDDKEIRLTPDDWRVLVFLGAHRRVRDLLRYSGSGEIPMLRSLDRLASAGLIEVEDPIIGGHALSQGGVTAHVRGEGPEGSAPEVIRIPESSSTDEVSKASFDIALVGSETDGLGGRVEGFLRGLAGRLPVRICSFVVEADFGDDGTDPRAKHVAPKLRKGGLQPFDLVVGFDWSHVESAIAIGKAPRAKTFALLELWALIDDVSREAAFFEGAREVVRRANARRIRNAHRLATFEVRDSYEATAADRNLQEVCEAIARALFPAASTKIPLTDVAISRVPDRRD